MSYRKDSRSPRNSGNFGGGMNRRQNYGGGGGSGGGGFGQVSPWQGGIVPGANQLGLSGQASLLSQLSSQETQLAMATNLLKILAPQEQFPSRPPSLLSLPLNRNMGTFGDNRSQWTPFADRRRDRPDSRRRQPYNKSGSNRHQDGKPRFGLGKSPRFNSDKTGTPKSKKKETEKKIKEEKDKLNGNADKEDKESKRQENDKAGDTKKKDESSAESKAAAAGKFIGVPQKMLNCHVCQKTMWDATSFEKHLSGRSHQMMMEQRDETYKLKVELLQHEQRACESQREMEIERFQRQGKKVFNNKRFYCKMCDLNFFGNLTSHRKREHHLKLKAFLHPKCRFCHKEFPNRLRWDEHRLTGKHLQILAEHRRNKSSNKDDDKDIDCNDSLDEMEDDLFVPTKEVKIEFDLTEIPSTIDNYDSKNTVGELLIADVSGHLCRGCDKFFSTKEEADRHLHSFTHYKNYASLVNSKVQAEKDKVKKEKTTKEEEDDEDADGEEEDDEESEKPSQGGDSGGTWKRHKRGGGSKSKTDSEEEDDEDQEMKLKEEEEDEEEEEEVAEKEAVAVKEEKELKMEVEVEESNEKCDDQNNDEENEEEIKKVEEPKTPRNTVARNKAFRGSARGKARRGGK